MSEPRTARIRREPPAFRRMEVVRTEELTPHMVRVTFTGSELEGLTVKEPAASVRLLVPSPGADDLVIPEWTGNEFLMPGGARPVLRTFTPKRFDSRAPELDLDIVIHPGGAVSAWTRDAQRGDPAAVSGPGRGYTVDPTASGFVLAGDETALPAIGQLLEAIPADAPVRVLVEVAHADARLTLPDHPAAVVEWLDLPPGEPPGHALVAAVSDFHPEPATRIWAAGEAAAMQRIRRHLFEVHAVPRPHATVRGYWKHGREPLPDRG